MLWNPSEHTDQENLRWSWLRAVEWGRWPIFLSQPIAPILLIWFPWYLVTASFVILNFFWALFVRYRFVNVNLAYIGSSLVILKWISWPASTIYLFMVSKSPECWIAAFWPAIIFLIGAIPTTRVGTIQASLMKELGYEPTDVNPLAGRV